MVYRAEPDEDTLANTLTVEIKLAPETLAALSGMLKLIAVAKQPLAEVGARPPAAATPVGLPPDLPPDCIGVEGLPARLKAARLHRRLSQLDLKRITGIGNSSIGTWEIGKAIPRKSSLRKIAKALRCNPTWLWTGKGKYERKY